MLVQSLVTPFCRTRQTPFAPSRINQFSSISLITLAYHQTSRSFDRRSHGQDCSHLDYARQPSYLLLYRSNGPRETQGRFFILSNQRDLRRALPSLPAGFLARALFPLFSATQVRSCVLLVHNPAQEIRFAPSRLNHVSSMSLVTLAYHPYLISGLSTDVHTARTAHTWTELDNLHLSSLANHMACE